MTDPLERAIEQFVDAAMTGDWTQARHAFADAQAHALLPVGHDAELWAALERRAAMALPDDLDDHQKAERLLRQHRTQGPT